MARRPSSLLKANRIAPGAGTLAVVMPAGTSSAPIACLIGHLSAVTTGKHASGQWRNL